MSINNFEPGPSTFVLRCIYLSSFLLAAAIPILGSWGWVISALICAGILGHYLAVYREVRVFEMNMKLRKEIFGRLDTYAGVIFAAKDAEKQRLQDSFGAALTCSRVNAVDFWTVIPAQLNGFRTSFIDEIYISRMLITFRMASEDTRLLSQAEVYMLVEIEQVILHVFGDYFLNK